MDILYPTAPCSAIKLGEGWFGGLLLREQTAGGDQLFSFAAFLGSSFSLLFLQYFSSGKDPQGKQGWKYTEERNASPLVQVTPQLEAAGFVTSKKTNLCTEPYPEAESDTAQSQSSKGRCPRPFHIQRK